MVPLLQKRKVVPTQKPAQKPPVAVVGPSTVAAQFPPSAQTAPLAQPAQAVHAAPALPEGLADDRMEEENEYLLDLPDPDNDEFVYNVEAALAMLEVVTDDEEDI